jgi:hypothetical protein
MTRTISLITATVGAALLFAVPAYADNWGADKSQPTTSSSPDWFERTAAVAIQKQKVEMLNARERGLGITGSAVASDPRSEGMNRLYGLGEYANPIDLRERAMVERPGTTTKEPQAGFDARSDGLNRLYGLGEYSAPVVADDRFRIDHSNVPVTVSATSSGREIDIPQVGIGFGIGLVLLLGIFLALRAAHVRPFAH